MNPAYQPYLNAHRARARLALALKERRLGDLRLHRRRPRRHR